MALSLLYFLVDGLGWKHGVQIFEMEKVFWPSFLEACKYEFLTANGMELQHVVWMLADLVRGGPSQVIARLASRGCLTHSLDDGNYCAMASALILGRLHSVSTSVP